MATYFETDLTGYEPLNANHTKSKTYKVNPEKGTIINRKNMFMGHLQGNGYVSIKLSNCKSNYLHQAVYRHVHGPDSIPFGMEVDHRDDIRHHNMISNLQVLTPSANKRKAAKNRDYSFVKNNHANRREVVATNTDTGEETTYRSCYKAGKELSINAGIICNCCKKQCNAKSGFSKQDSTQYTFRFAETV